MSDVQGTGLWVCGGLFSEIQWMHHECWPHGPVDRRTRLNTLPFKHTSIHFHIERTYPKILETLTYVLHVLFLQIYLFTVDVCGGLLSSRNLTVQYRSQSNVGRCVRQSCHHDQPTRYVSLPSLSYFAYGLYLPVSVTSFFTYCFYGITFDTCSLIFIRS